MRIKRQRCVSQGTKEPLKRWHVGFPGSLVDDSDHFEEHLVVAIEQLSTWMFTSPRSLGQVLSSTSHLFSICRSTGWRQGPCIDPRYVGRTKIIQTHVCDMQELTQEESSFVRAHLDHVKFLLEKNTKFLALTPLLFSPVVKIALKLV